MTRLQKNVRGVLGFPDPPTFLDLLQDANATLQECVLEVAKDSRLSRQQLLACMENLFGQYSDWADGAVAKAMADLGLSQE